MEDIRDGRVKSLVDVEQQPKKLNGYLDAYRKNGLKVSDKWYRELNENENWEDFAKAILNDSNHPTAFFGICDSELPVTKIAVDFVNVSESHNVSSKYEI